MERKLMEIAEAEKDYSRFNVTLTLPKKQGIVNITDVYELTHVNEKGEELCEVFVKLNSIYLSVMQIGDRLRFITAMNVDVVKNDFSTENVNVGWFTIEQKDTQLQRFTRRVLSCSDYEEFGRVFNADVDSLCSLIIEGEKA